MKVDFNNVRRSAVEQYNRLITVLQSNKANGGSIEVAVEDIEGILNDLRMSIATIALSSKENDPELVNVLGEGVLEEINPE